MEAKQDEERRMIGGRLGDAENHLTKAELMRRGLEGEIQRLKMALNDKETEKQVTKHTQQQ